jgi:hypothetical protein
MHYASPIRCVLIYLASHNGINTRSTDKHSNGICKLNYIESNSIVRTYGTEMIFKISFKTADGRTVAWGGSCVICFACFWFFPVRNVLNSCTPRKLVTLLSIRLAFKQYVDRLPGSIFAFVSFSCFISRQKVPKTHSLIPLQDLTM